MGLFDLFKKKKVKLSEQQLKWNKMWELWAKGVVESPYRELMTYQNEINNGGHTQYFTNIANTGDVQKEMAQLESILPSPLGANLRIAYHSYLKLEENKGYIIADRNIRRCDNTFFQHEEKIKSILEKHASEID